EPVAAPSTTNEPVAAPTRAEPSITNEPVAAPTHVEPVAAPSTPSAPPTQVTEVPTPREASVPPTSNGEVRLDPADGFSETPTSEDKHASTPQSTNVEKNDDLPK